MSNVLEHRRPSPSNSSCASWRWPVKHRHQPIGRCAVGPRANWPTKRSNAALSSRFLPARWSVFSKVSALQPHRKRSWLTPPPEDPAELAEQICTVCQVYEATAALAAAGTHVSSTDEMTAIQA